MSDKNITIASESHHWYQQDGTPCYEVPNKSNGGMRATTLRDAKKLNLVPSVTTVLNILAKPGLEQWKQKQVLMSALTLPKIDGETLDEYAARVLQDGAEQAKQAAETGTRIHGSIECAIQGNSYPEVDIPYVGAALAEMRKLNVNGWAVEKSFARNGYGGKVDLHSPEGIVIDFKTKEFAPEIPADKLVWPEMSVQLSAYRLGLGMPSARCFNVIVSVNNPGLAVTYEWPEEKLKQAEAIFLATLKVWRLVKGV